MNDIAEKLRDVGERTLSNVGFSVTGESAVAFGALLINASNALSEASGFALAASTAETKDAERYRYLRNVAGQYRDDEDGPSVVSGLGDLFEYHFGGEVDEVVDEAIAAWKAAGSPLPKEATK